MKSLLTTILDTLFPKQEAVVFLEQQALQGNLRSLPHAPKTPERWMHSIFQYKNEAVKKLIWEIKYSSNEVLTRETGALLGEEIISFFEEKGLYTSPNWILVAVPASFAHTKEKGFNQADKLCKAVIKSVNSDSLTYIPNLLRKTRETKPQASMRNRADRLTNLVGSFTVPKGYQDAVAGKNCIVIDDALTTGSTLREARRALGDAGAKTVLGLTLAH